MFHFGGNNVSIRRSTCEEHPVESVIISLTSATREYDLISFTTEQPSNLHSSFVNRLPRRAASPLAARRITVWPSTIILIASTTSGAVGVLALKSR
jgi:hypothetical protein